MMAASMVFRSHSKHTALGLDLSLATVTLAFASLFSSLHVCGSSDWGLEHIPTLKEIYGSVPKNSFPIVRLDATTSHRRLLRTKTDALTVQVTDITIRDVGFFAQVQLGTPPQTLVLQIDTGSSLFWAQSQQCIECYTELLPNYDPTISSTFEPEIVNTSHVVFNASYGGGNANIGYIARETLTIPSGDGNQLVIPEFQFGLAVNNTGPSFRYSGILGLIPTDPGNLSPFLAQLETLSNGEFRKFSKQFRYCFPDRATDYSISSFLSFGQIDESETDSLFSSTKQLHLSKMMWLPIIPNPVNLFYAVNMTAIKVGGTRIAIDPQELTLKSVQRDNIMTIIDSGTTNLFLRSPYSALFVVAYYLEISNLVPESFLSNLTLNISEDVFDAYLFPSVSLIFQNGQPEHADEEIELFLPKDNLLTFDSDLHVYILNVGSTTDGQNVIGYIAQQNFLVEYDLEKRRVGFLRASCTFD